MFLRKLRLVGLAILGAALLTISVCSPVPAHALTEELAPGTIMISETIYDVDFVEFLKATSTWGLPKYDIILHTNGGDAYACIAIMNRIMEMQADGVKVNMYVYGQAMSAGTYIFMLGDNRVIHEGASLMFHGMLAQQEPYELDSMQRDRPKVYNMILRMDMYITRILSKVTGWTDTVVEYWMRGGKAQFMSAETAYNTGIATIYKGRSDK